MTEKKAYAKINLFLDIESRRTDGYHNIVSVMQTVDWYDVVRVAKAEGEGIYIRSNDENVPTDSSNIVFRAAKAFLNKLNISQGISIEIEKNIPISAGMAGGSSDGAATLEGLNELFGFPFSTEDLISIGKELGADIPFCIVGGTKLAGGIGEIIEDAPLIPDCFIVCAKQGDDRVSTPEAYKALDDKYDGFYDRSFDRDRLDDVLGALAQKDIDGVCKSVFNIFEEVIIPNHKSVSALKQQMLDGGAKAALMSGSGPSVFGFFTEVEKAQIICENLKNQNVNARVCKPINK